MSSGYGPRPSHDDLSPPGPPTQPRRQRVGRQPRRPFGEGGRRSRVGARAVVLGVVGFILSGILGAGAYFAPSFLAALSETGNQSVIGGAGNSFGPPPPGAPFTVLLLGSDDDAKFDPQHVLTQSM